jgi:hypothetical protein
MLVRLLKYMCICVISKKNLIIKGTYYWAEIDRSITAEIWNRLLDSISI